MREWARVALDSPGNEDAPLAWSDPMTKPDAQGLVIRMADKDRHRGEGFHSRLRGEDWSKKWQFRDMDEYLTRLTMRGEIGDIVVVQSLKSGAKFLTRIIGKPEVEDKQTEGNADIDDIFTFVFFELSDEDAKFIDMENWGICNKRTISGSSTPTQHCPWKPAQNYEAGPGSNAIDIGIPGSNVKARGDKLMNMLINQKGPSGDRTCGKIIWWGGAWYVDDGHVVNWHPIGGIGHFDHLHVQGQEEHPGLWSLVGASC